MTATLDHVVITKQVLKEERQYVYKCSVCDAMFDEKFRVDAEKHVAEHTGGLRYTQPNGYGGTYVTEHDVRNGRVMHKVYGNVKIDWVSEGWYVHDEREQYCDGGDYQNIDVLIHVDKAFSEAREKLRELAETYRFYIDLRKKPAP